VVISELEPESVNQVYIQSPYEYPLLIINGTILEGGRQTRTATRPFILNKTPQKRIIPVNCVEHGRWEYNEKNQVHDDHKRFKFSSKRVSRKMHSSFASAGYSQSSTWSAIEQMQESNAISSEQANTSNYLEVEKLTMEKSNEKITEIKEKISGAFLNSDQRGVLVFEDGEISSIEVFQSSEHWKKVSASIMDSNLTDLLQESETKEFSHENLDISTAESEQTDPIGDEQAQYIKYKGLEGWGVGLDDIPIYISLHKPEVFKNSMPNSMSNLTEQIQYQSNQIPEEE